MEFPPVVKGFGHLQTHQDAIVTVKYLHDLVLTKYRPVIQQRNVISARSRKMHLSMLKIGRNFFPTLLRELLGLRRNANVKSKLYFHFKILLMI